MLDPSVSDPSVFDPSVFDSSVNALNISFSSRVTSCVTWLCCDDLALSLSAIALNAPFNRFPEFVCFSFGDNLRLALSVPTGLLSNSSSTKQPKTIENIVVLHSCKE